MITVDQIRAMLQQVILASVSLDQFDEWLSKASWNMHHDSSPEAISLVGKIELILATYDEGLQSEDHALSCLRDLPVFLFNNSNAASISTGGTGNVVSRPSTQWVVVGKQPASVFSYTPVLPG
jgi:hypothetical protein